MGKHYFCKEKEHSMLSPWAFINVLVCILDNSSPLKNPRGYKTRSLQDQCGHVSAIATYVLKTNWISTCKRFTNTIDAPIVVSWKIEESVSIIVDWWCIQSVSILGFGDEEYSLIDPCIHKTSILSFAEPCLAESYTSNEFNFLDRLMSSIVRIKLVILF